ncbi:MAG: hypothetical protein FWG80_02950 [Alphaproteobacteria bacterium]|nr:hypothetical protein [Alphaproteobacteria bacterium]
MKNLKQIFFKSNTCKLLVCSLFIIQYSLFIMPQVAEAARAQSRAAPTSRMAIANTAAPVAQPIEEIPESVPEPVAPEPAPVPQMPRLDLSHIFEEVVGNKETALAKTIRAQREAFAAAAAMESYQADLARFSSGTGNTCDSGLRKCMAERCGKDFSDCTGDGDTVWGNKIESCGRTTNCSGRELILFSAEIKADRDQNALLARFEAVERCGRQYNECILGNCSDPTCNETNIRAGRCNFDKCLSKSEGDAVIAKCRDIAERCREQDSGLAGRAMTLFAELRVDVEKEIVRWEEQLYKMREDMRNECRSISGVFDDRSLSCVFHVELTATGFESAAATRTLAAGDEYMCTPEWFGVDISTYIENAARYEREQQGAINAVMGAGMGMAAGSILSGEMSRNTATRNAQTDLDKEVCEQAGKTEWKSQLIGNGKCVCTEKDFKWNKKEKKCIEQSQCKGNDCDDDDDEDETKTSGTRNTDSTDGDKDEKKTGGLRNAASAVGNILRRN